jgi:hypothetical protein
MAWFNRMVICEIKIITNSLHWNEDAYGLYKKSS